ncbi:unnamed protein product [Trichobilharzia regenti]|nr:unnamed protein product [Trichobilharzia regenti]
MHQIYSLMVQMPLLNFVMLNLLTIRKIQKIH